MKVKEFLFGKFLLFIDEKSTFRVKFRHFIESHPILYDCY